MKWFWLVIVLGLGVAHAQVPAGGDGTAQLGVGLIEGLPPGPPPAESEIDGRTEHVAETLRCPVCQALSVNDSSSQAARMFQERVRQLVAAGYTDDQIRDYFVDRYGEWILLDPAPDGLNGLLYILPALLLGLGAVAVGATVTQWRKEPDEVPLPSDEGIVEMDDYERRLLKELDE
jgi:cytochrome c-type biogenesis protein CcmH